jgi:hypothetical protein
MVWGHTRYPVCARLCVDELFLWLVDSTHYDVSVFLMPRLSFPQGANFPRSPFIWIGKSFGYFYVTPDVDDDADMEKAIANLE